MPNSISGFAGNAKIFTLIDAHLPSDANTHPKKELIEILDWNNVTTTTDCKDSSGGASVSFNDMDFRFWKYYPLKYLYTKNFNDNLKSKNGDFIRLSEKDKKLSNPNSAGSIQYSLRNKTEITGFRQALAKYANEHAVYQALNLMLEGSDKLAPGDTALDIEKGGVLEPMLDLQNLIWIFLFGRDGFWYPKFAGLITSIRYSDPLLETPKIDVGAKPFTRLFDYSRIATGLPNLGGVDSVEQSALVNQYSDGQIPKGLAFNNILATMKTASEVIQKALEICNNFFLQTLKPGETWKASGLDEPDEVYFRVPDIFAIPKHNTTESTTGKTISEVTHFKIGDPAMVPIKYAFNDSQGIQVNQLYNGWDIPEDKWAPVTQAGVVPNSLIKSCLSKVFILDDFSLMFKPYQNLIRSNIQLGVLDSKTIRDVLDVVKKTTLCYIYCDGDGNLKVERPNFDLSPWGDFNEVRDTEGKPTSLGYIPSKYNDVLTDKDRQIPADYDERYIMCKKDQSYLDSSYERVESSIVTRTSTWMQTDFLNFDEFTQKALFAGKAESSAKTYSKFGLRDIVLDPIVRADFFNSGELTNILDSYAEAMKMQMNAEAVPAEFTLDQRPDLHVNRNMYYLDKGYVTLITILTDTLDASTGTHVTQVKGAYTRPIGYPLINPFRFLIAKDENGKYILEEFNVDPAKDVKKEPALKTKKEIFNTPDITSDETFDKVLESMKKETDGKFLDKKLNEDQIIGYSLIRRFTQSLGFNNKSYDIIYFLYKKDGVGQILKYRGWSHPTHIGDLIETEEGGLGRFSAGFTQLEQGLYNYYVSYRNYTSGATKEQINKLTLSCDDFYYSLLDKDLKFIPNSKKLSSTKKFNDAGLNVKDFRSFITHLHTTSAPDLYMSKTNQDYTTYWSGVNIGTSTSLSELEAVIKTLNVQDIYVLNVYTPLTNEDKETDANIKSKTDNANALQSKYLNLNPFSKVLIFTADLAKTGKIKDYSSSPFNISPNVVNNPWGFNAANINFYISKFNNKEYPTIEAMYDTIISDYITNLNSLLSNDAISFYKAPVRYVVEEKGVNYPSQMPQWCLNEYVHTKNSLGKLELDPSKFKIENNSFFPQFYGTQLDKGKKVGRNTYAAMIGLIHLGVISSGISISDLGKIKSTDKEFLRQVFQYIAYTYGLYSLPEDFGGDAKVFFTQYDETTVKFDINNLEFSILMNPDLRELRKNSHLKFGSGLTDYSKKCVPQFENIKRTFIYEMGSGPRGVIKTDEDYLRNFFVN